MTQDLLVVGIRSNVGETQVAVFVLKAVPDGSGICKAEAECLARGFYYLYCKRADRVLGVES